MSNRALGETRTSFREYGVDLTGLSDLIFGTEIRCIRIPQASSCNLGKHAADHRIKNSAASCRVHRVLKQYRIQLCAASSKSGYSLKHVYA
jgi:hypothetical protein